MIRLAGIRNGVVVRNGDYAVAFFPDTLAAVAVDPSRLPTASADSELVLSPGVDPALAQTALSPVEPAVTTAPRLLVANVTHRCNLACRYCYVRRPTGAHCGDPLPLSPHPSGAPTRSAPGDPAPSAPGEPSPSTFARWVDRVLTAFPSITAIKFFGGEPLLALGVVRAVCELVEDHRRAGRRLELTLISNGTRLTPTALDLLVRHKVAVTLSIDGPASLHDRLRPDGRGRATLARALAAADQLRRSGATVSVEATYTRPHLESGASVTNVLEALAGMGFDYAEVSPVLATGNDAVDFRPGDWPAVTDSFAQAAWDSVLASRPDARGVTASMVSPGSTRSPMARLSLVARRLYTLRERTWDLDFCAVWPVSATLDGDGCLYTCYLDGAEPALPGRAVSSAKRLLARVDEASSPADLAREVGAAAAALPATTKTGSACRNCWARAFCKQCVARLTREGGSPAIPPEHLCRLSQTVTAAVLLALAHIRDYRGGESQNYGGREGLTWTRFSMPEPQSSARSPD